MSSIRSPATSPARSPRRDSSVNIAASRSPAAVDRSHESTSALTCSGFTARGSPGRRLATLGTASTNDEESTPSRCQNRSSDRIAVAVRWTVFGVTRRDSATKNALTSPAVTRRGRAPSPATPTTNGRTEST
jgi:hypothetical protein